jgi:hypothetical protein
MTDLQIQALINGMAGLQNSLDAFNNTFGVPFWVIVGMVAFSFFLAGARFGR